MAQKRVIAMGWNNFCNQGETYHFNEIISQLELLSAITV